MNVVVMARAHLESVFATLVGVEKAAISKRKSLALKIVTNKVCAIMMENAIVTQDSVAEIVLLQCRAQKVVRFTAYASTDDAFANLGTPG